MNARNYRCLTESELRATRKSDTVFIFGSGYSINEISDPEWRAFELHDTLSFNLFVHQDRVRIDYHMVREVGNRWYSSLGFRMSEVLEYMGLLNRNPCYADSILLVQEGWKARGGNYVVGKRMLPRGVRLFRFRSERRRGYQPPSRSLSNGLVHGQATLIDCVNLAYLLGWKFIVLVGVDLYDRRYFWLDANETKSDELERGASPIERHNTADGVVQYLDCWRQQFEADGVELFVYNPRSMLAKVLPVYVHGLAAARKPKKDSASTGVMI